MITSGESTFAQKNPGTNKTFPLDFKTPIKMVDHSNDTIPALVNHTIDIYNMSISERDHLSNKTGTNVSVMFNSSNDVNPLTTSNPYMQRTYSYWTTNGIIDNSIPVYLHVQYINEGDQNTYNIPDASLEIYSTTCTGTAFYTYLLDSLGNANPAFSGNHMTICIKVSMRDARLGNNAAGWVTDPNGNTYYTTASNYDIYDQYKNYITITIHYSSTPSNVGAAAVYCRIVEAKNWFNTYATGFSNIQVYWPIAGLIGGTFYATQYYINIGSNIADDVAADWSINYLDDVTHEYGHLLQYAFYWTGTWPTGCGTHQLDFQFNTGNEATNLQCAFIEGFADFYPMWVYNRDTTYPNSWKHFENVVFTLPDLVTWSNGAGWYTRADLHDGLRYKGEDIEVNIAMIFFDIMDSSSTSRYPAGSDDDPFNGCAQMLANVLWNYHPVDIFQFWDAWQRYYYWDTAGTYVSELANVYLQNNVARFIHNFREGESAVDTNGLSSLNFEILSMNTQPIVDSSHKILVRYQLHNPGTTTINFDANIGIYTACEDNGNNCDFGYQHTLPMTGHLLSGQYYEYVGTTFVTGVGNWYFWPCYELQNGGNYCNWGFNDLGITPQTDIFTDNFEGSWLWTSWDATSTCGNDYWGISANRPDHGTYSAWNSANGVKDCNEGGTTTYDDYMDSYMKITNLHDLRYIYWKVHYNIWYEQEQCCDYSQFQIGTTVYQYSGSSGNPPTWGAATHDNSIFGNQQLSNIDIQFYFHSDLSVVYRGVYIDDFQITYEA